MESDKIASWNIFGVQGALLSHLIEPIYFTSITIGDLFHEEALERALNSRIKDVAGKSHSIS